MIQTDLGFTATTNSNPSQCKRLLRMLQLAGRTGITTTDCYQRGIWRGASRINELRKAGHNIETVERRPVARYVLHKEPIQYDTD